MGLLVMRVYVDWVGGVEVDLYSGRPLCCFRLAARRLFNFR